MPVSERMGRKLTAPSLASTGGAFSSVENVPVGHFMQFISGMTTDGTNTPRNNDVLNSLQLQDVLVLDADNLPFL